MDSVTFMTGSIKSLLFFVIFGFEICNFLSVILFTLFCQILFRRIAGYVLAMMEVCVADIVDAIQVLVSPLTSSGELC